jgi:hypothetical protein
MNRIFLEEVFSAERMQKYFRRQPSDDLKSLLHYQYNILASEAFYPSISVLEVALRNSVDRELAVKFGGPDWYRHFSTTPGLSNLINEIALAQGQIKRRHELVTPSKIVAELTLGFWVRLFNSEYERVLWKDLRRAFPNLPKVDRKRHNVSAPLNNFRIIRNRIFHNEPICWNLSRIQQRHEEIVTVLGWISKDLPGWLKPLDRFDRVLSEVKIGLG